MPGRPHQQVFQGDSLSDTQTSVFWCLDATAVLQELLGLLYIKVWVNHLDQSQHLKLLTTGKGGGGVNGISKAKAELHLNHNPFHLSNCNLQGGIHHFPLQHLTRTLIHSALSQSTATHPRTSHKSCDKANTAASSAKSRKLILSITKNSPSSLCLKILICGIWKPRWCSWCWTVNESQQDIQGCFPIFAKKLQAHSRSTFFLRLVCGVVLFDRVVLVCKV